MSFVLNVKLRTLSTYVCRALINMIIKIKINDNLRIEFLDRKSFELINMTFDNKIDKVCKNKKKSRFSI